MLAAARHKSSSLLMRDSGQNDDARGASETSDRRSLLTASTGSPGAANLGMSFVILPSSPQGTEGFGSHAMTCSRPHVLALFSLTR